MLPGGFLSGFQPYLKALRASALSRCTSTVQERRAPEHSRLPAPVVGWEAGHKMLVVQMMVVAQQPNQLAG